nr:exocyst complex component EXO70B1-like isoform X1 [Ipomoea trifida]
MGEEKDKSQNETPSSSAENHNHHDHDHNQEPEAARNEEEQCVEHTEKPPSVEADYEAKPDENEGRTASDDHQETTSGGEPELPPDLSKVSEEVDQYISDNDTLLESRGGGGGEGGDESSPKSSPHPDGVPIFVEQFALLLEDMLQGYSSGGETAVKWRELEEDDAAALLEAVNRICRLYRSVSQFYSPEHQRYAKSINHPEETTPLPPPVFPGYPEETVSKLNRLAKAMISGGYETECCQVYFVSRRNALEESLRGKLGYEGHSIDDVQKMSWEIVEREISTWIAAFNHCATVLFSCERKLSDAVFNDCPQLSTSSEAIFNNLSGGLVIQFLIFPEAVAMTKRSAEKLFKFLDLYETMRDHLPTAYDNFPPDYVNELKAEAALTRGRLGEGMVGIFSELENSIQSDSSKTPVPGGAVHPLSRYTMNYLKLAGDYKETLEQVFREHQKIERADSATGSDFDYNSQPVESYKPPTAPKQSPFELQIRKVMEILELNLESKSKIYNNLPLCSIFMMNNGRYILQKVRGSPPINQLMGDQWLRKQSQELRQYHKTYQRETWGRLLQCLSIEGLLTSHGKVNKPVLKERFKSFNLMFDEIHRTQSTWVISDEQLLSELRISISSMVIPAYRSFLARYSQIFTPGRQTEKYIKFQEDDIETYIDELFDGKK